MKITLEAKEVIKTTEGYGIYNEHEEDSEVRLSHDVPTGMCRFEFEDKCYNICTIDLIKTLRLLGDY